MTILSDNFADECRARGLTDEQIERFLRVLAADPRFIAMAEARRLDAGDLRAGRA